MADGLESEDLDMHELIRGVSNNALHARHLEVKMPKVPDLVNKAHTWTQAKDFLSLSSPSPSFRGKKKSNFKQRPKRRLNVMGVARISPETTAENAWPKMKCA